MILKSSLISGTGNTFHLLYDVHSIGDLSEFTKKVCAEFPADGVVFLFSPQNLYFPCPFRLANSSKLNRLGYPQLCLVR